MLTITAVVRAQEEPKLTPAETAKAAQRELKQELGKPSLFSLSTAASQVVPRVFDAASMGRLSILDGVHPLSSIVTDWFLADPIAAFAAGYRLALPAVRAFKQKDALFGLLGLYLEALARADFGRAVKPNSTKPSGGSCPDDSCIGPSYAEYSDFIFADPAFERRGLKRKAWVAEMVVHPGTPLSKVAEPQRLEHYLVAIEKFFHRRGELFGMLAAYHGLRLCQDLAASSVTAQRILTGPGPRLRERYERFRAAWAAGRLPQYPYDRHAKAKNHWSSGVQIPQHLDARVVWQKHRSLPALQVTPPQTGAVAFKPAPPRPAAELVELRSATLARSGSEIEFKELLAEMALASDLRLVPRAWISFLKAARQRRISSALSDQAIWPMRVGWRCPTEECVEDNRRNIAALAKAGLREEAVKLYNLVMADNAADCVRGDESAVGYSASLHAGDADLLTAIGNATLTSRLNRAGAYNKLPATHPLRRSLIKQVYEGICSSQRKACLVSDRCQLMLLR